MRSPVLPALLALSTTLTACGKEEQPASPPAGAAQSAKAPSPAAPTGKPVRAAAIAHGGVGSPPAMSDGCRAAVDAALAALEKGADPLDAAVAGVVVMEDDPRFNAGTGSRVRIDGVTVQMDASVMDSAGRFGAVSVIEGVKNPVKVARAVADTPHLLLAGDGATRFARALGMPPYDPSTPETRAKTAAIQEQLRRADPSLPPQWKDFQWRSTWNFERTLEEAGLAEKDAGSDTVGVVVRTADGRFAAAATGKGERIMEAGLARAVHGWLEAGASPSEAADRAVREIKPKGEIGIIVAGTEGLAAAADRPMAWAARSAGESAWQGPEK
jgi:isoaspartyl peptidase/L-asparaginase-like protein (Ntn-hydrolase superfamily)